MVEVKMNIINQLRLFRQSTFKDKLCFLDENIQNAQRAKATEVKVTIDSYEKVLIIENNGAVLEDPQSLFSIAESGWDNDIIENENPFGIGFFSNISVSDKIEILSGDNYIMFDVNEMINTKNCDINVQKSEKYYHHGFKLILHNFDFDDIYEFQIRDRLALLGKYIHELDIYYDGHIQQKKKITEVDEEYCFSAPIDDKDIKGWIAICSNYSFESNISIFYKGRFVTKVDSFPYLTGDIHINDRVLNLTSPDRKDIIRDNKFDNFRDLIELYIKELAENSFSNGNDSDIEYHSNAINKYINKQELVKKNKFASFNNTNIDYLQGIAIAKAADKNIKTFDGYRLWLDKEAAKQEETKSLEIIVKEEMITRVPLALGEVYSMGSGGYVPSSTTKPEIKDKELEEKDGEIIFNNSQCFFWVGFDEIERFEYKFNVIKHYNLNLLVARNKVEKEVLACISSEYKVHHIAELSESISFETSISNMKLNTKETRALMVFDMISRIFESDHNLFSIGDVMVTKNIEITKTEIKETLIDDDVVIIRDSVSDKVYVDRSIIETGYLSDHLEEEINLKDVQFVLKHIDDISKAINLLKSKSIIEIKDRIIDILSVA